MPRYPKRPYGPVVRTTELPEVQPATSRPQTAGNPPASAFSQLVAKHASQTQSEDDAFALAPDDPTLDTPAIRDAEHAARLWMTAMKLFNPLVRAVITQAADSYSPDALMGNFYTLMKATNELTAALMERIRDDGRLDTDQPENRWIMRQIVPLVAEAVADQWRTYGTVNTTALNALYQEVLNHLLAQGRPDQSLDMGSAFLEAASYDDRFLRIPASEALTLSQLAAMEPIVSEISLFSAWQDAGTLAGDLATILTENAEYLYRLHDGGMLSPRSRLILMQACLKHAGAMLHDAYRHHAGELLSEYDRLDDQSKQALKARFAPGSPDAESWRQTIAIDARQRCQILHEAALAGRRAMDILLKHNPPSP